MNNTGFVFGVPRSGTTLLANILDSHPNCICLIEPYLSLTVKNYYSYEEYEENLSKNPIQFLSERDELGVFKETFRSTWVKPSFENSQRVSDFVQKVDCSLSIVRDIRAIWCSTINAWNDQRGNIDMYKRCWLDFIDFIEREGIEVIKYEDLAKGRVEPNDIFSHFGLDQVEDFRLKERSLGQPGDSRAKKSKEIDRRGLSYWKNEIRSSEREHLEKECSEELEKFNYE